MKQAGLLVVAAILVLWLVWTLWSVFRVVTGLRDGSWRRPLWWARLASAALLAGFASWLRGAFSGGLDAGEWCRFVHHQYYDAAYAAAHAQENDTFFPLHNRCNASYDMVPGWVNPAVVTCAALAVAAVAVLAWFGLGSVARLLRRSAGRRTAGSCTGS